MPQTNQLAHRNVTSMALPYRSNISPTDTTPSFVSGSGDMITSINGYAERRPGFSINVETTPTTFNNLQRIFSWDRWDGTFIIMAVDINASNQAVVYKLVNGTDTSFVSIFTDTTPNVFDFVVSNNTVYFANGNVAKKWNPPNGISNWGIAIGSVSSATGPNGVGTGSDVAFGSPWANPGNITANDGSFATVTMTQGSNLSQGPNGFGSQSFGADWTNIGGGVLKFLSPGGSGSTSLILNTNYGFSIPLTATINGIQVITTVANDNGGGSTGDASDITVELLKGGTAVGSNKATFGFIPGPGFSTITYGSSSDLWGTAWTPSDVNGSGFGVELGYSFINFTFEIKVSTVTIQVFYTPAAGALFSDYLQGTNTSLSIGSTNSILGILVEIKGLQSVANANTSLSVQLLKAGNLAGTAKTGMNLGLSNAFVSFGGTGDLWGTTWSANDINQSTFGVSMQAVDNTAGSVTWSIDFVRITVYSFGGPNVTFTGTGLTATIGYQYVFTYGNSTTGHISSPTPPSNVVKPTNQSMSIPLTASTDPQVNQIHLYRSTDSVAAGTTAGIYFELPTSPYPNTTQSVTDSAADTALNVASIAPNPGFNDPPPPGFQPVYFSGRIWLFKNNQVFFSSLEESVAGVPEESFVSGTAGNFWNFDQAVQGLAVAGTSLSQTIGAFCGGRLYGITGNSLDTFRKFLVSNRRGCRSLDSITALGGMVAWFDSSSTIWVTDGNSLQEVSLDIRPDLIGLNPSTSNFTFHTSGRFHWLVCGFANKLFLYDLDLSQWLPPWNISTKAVFSGETSPGNYQLMVSTGPRALALNQAGTVGSFNDNGFTYQPILKTANHAVVPDFGKRFSYASLGLYDQPSKTGTGWYIQSDTNSLNTFVDVGILVDDDPLNSASIYNSIAVNKITPQVAWNRGQGNFLVQNIYSMNGPLGRWYAIKLTLPKVDQVDKIYSYFLAYEERK